MLKRAMCIAAVVCLSLLTFAQSPCSTTAITNKMICQIPQIYGPNGLRIETPGHEAHFSSSFQSSFTPLTSEVGSQLTLLPLASPASGVTFTFDPSLGVATRSTESFGPVLTERGETIGRHKLYLAFTFQHFHFTNIDGVDMNDIPAVYTHQDVVLPGVPGAGVLGVPDFEKDVVVTKNSIDLTVNQFTSYATFGLTNRVDVSIAVPVLNVSMGVVAVSHIVQNGAFVVHLFPNGTVDQTFSSSQSKTGIGDVVFRGKANLYKGEKSRFAAGLDLRLPTGDATNFLGTGAVGVRPFAIWSYASRVSPHFNLGYEWNGDSILAGDVATGTKDKLPDQFLYSGGVDVGLAKKITFAADYIGQVLIGANRAAATTFTDLGDTTGTRHTYPDIAFVGKSNFVLNNLGLGVKINPVGNLLLTGNVLIRLNDGGLRPDPVPMAGISYTF